MWVVELGGGLDWITTLRRIVIFVCLLAGHITPAHLSRVSYAVLEGQPTATFVGDLLRDGNLTEGRRPTFTVRRRQQSTALPFSVDRRSGVVRTVGVLDREELCPPGPDWGTGGLSDPDSGEQCLVNFEVSVRTATSSRILRVDVAILDLNDNSPTFPENQVTRV